MALSLGMLLAAATTAHATTTLDRRIVPGPTGPGGYTPLVDGPGEPTQTDQSLAKASPDRAGRRRSLLSFAQLSDFQLADEESPLRVEVFDQVNSAFSAAWRPQEALMPYMVDAAVRQVNANQRSPIPAAGGRHAKLAFTLLTGDNADNQEGNEASWVNRLLEGGRLDPNSGVITDQSMRGSGCQGADRAALAREAPKYTGVQDYDDYVESGTFYDPDQPTAQWAGFPRYPGLMDRAQQPFTATGLKVPSYIALGNHDGLVQGNEAATKALSDRATGCVKAISTAFSADLAGLTDSVLTTDPTKTVIVPPDPDRAPVTKPEYRARFANRHGFQFIDAAEATASRGAASYYTFSPRKGIRFVALDTIANAGVIGPGSEGNIDDPQFQWLKKELDKAERANELVFLFSHHGPQSLSTNIGDEVAGACDDPDHPSNAGCDLDPRSSTPLHLQDDLVNLVLAHPHVVAWVAGHSHINDVQLYKQGAKGFYVVRTSAEADYPHQDRLLELMDNRDGTLSLFGTLLDNAAPAAAPASGSAASQFTPDQLASVARTLGYNDPQVNRAAVGEPSDQNVELVIPDPRGTKGTVPSASLRVSLRPRRVVAGRRTTLRIRVRLAGEAVRGARVRLASKVTRTNRRGRARLRVTLRRPGRRAVKVRIGNGRAVARFRVVHSVR